MAEGDGLRCSPWFRSAAVGGPPNQPDYINGVALLHCCGSPMGLLQRLQALERQAGRRPGPRWQHAVLCWRRWWPWIPGWWLPTPPAVARNSWITVGLLTPNRHRHDAPARGGGHRGDSPRPGATRLVPGWSIAGGDGLCAGALPGLCPLCPWISPPRGAGSLLAAFALAWTAGLVIPGASAGLGIFDVVLVLWLGGTVQDEAALLATCPQRPGGVHHGGRPGGRHQCYRFAAAAAI